jgi:glutathione synthase/RimK-type ligase-like ATP-grasp enzyme
MRAEEIYQPIRLINGSAQMDAVFCNQESNLVTAKTLRKMLNANDPLNIEMPLFRNKILMKSQLEQAQLRVPHFINGTNFASPDMDHPSLCCKLGTPYIIKPCSSVGSRGVFKVENQSDLSFNGQSSHEALPYLPCPFVFSLSFAEVKKMSRSPAGQMYTSSVAS